MDLTIGLPDIPRRRSEERVYSTMFYHSRCKEAVEEFIRKNNTPSHAHVAERARITAEMYAAEEDHIKKAVRDEIQALEDKRDLAKAAIEALETGTAGDVDASPLEYAQ